jgi:hypothetical protein
MTKALIESPPSLRRDSSEDNVDVRGVGPEVLDGYEEIPVFA